MIIESTISQREFTRHALSRYFRRPIFYVFAFVAAILTAFVIYDPSIRKRRRCSAAGFRFWSTLSPVL